ncbi:MAG: WbqC family protein, partial [Flavobacteriales bacterium]|nr:WbqC family protein [Flavobacteriales bacterium]
MENKKIRILCDHQTGYLPWLGLFHRISLSDIYVSLDTVKYNPRSYDSRNKIKTPDGFKWLNVPTLK